MLIAKEMSRILGLGQNISDAQGLPKLDEDGKVGWWQGATGTRGTGGRARSCAAAAPPLPVAQRCASPASPASCLLPCRRQIPKDLHKYAKLIVEADGFAQVYPEHKVGGWGGWGLGWGACLAACTASALPQPGAPTLLHPSLSRPRST